MEGGEIWNKMASAGMVFNCITQAKKWDPEKAAPTPPVAEVEILDGSTLWKCSALNEDTLTEPGSLGNQRLSCLRPEQHTFLTGESSSLPSTAGGYWDHKGPSVCLLPALTPVPIPTSWFLLLQIPSCYGLNICVLLQSLVKPNLSGVIRWCECRPPKWD